MNLVNYIPDEELELINDWRMSDQEVKEAIARHGKEIVAPIRIILKEWGEQKQTLYKLLGENIIISKNILIQKEEAMLIEEAVNALRNNKFVHELIEKRKIINDKIKFINKVEDEYNFFPTAYDVMYELTRTAVLVHNECGVAGKFVFEETGHSIQFDYKTKPMRVLTKCAEELGFKYFEEFRLKVSQVLNNKNFHGELCLSIHPLDYMTMSNNACGWSSCMSWGEKYTGAYRGGVVEMMNSPIVVEAYLKSATDMEFPSGNTWNSKKWRELFIVSPYCLLAIKGYPYQADNITSVTMEWLRQLAADNLGWHYDEAAVRWIKELPFEVMTHAMYNDVYGEHLVAFRQEEEAGIIPEYLDYSGARTCMICGELYFESTMWEEIEADFAHITCDDCTPYIVCDNCGYPCLWDEAQEVDGELMCQSCYDELSFCAYCGDALAPRNFEVTHREYMITMNGVYNWNYVVPFCDNCISSGLLVDPDKIQELVADLEYYTSTILYIDYNDLTLEGQSVVDDYFSERYTAPVSKAVTSPYVKNTTVRPLEVHFTDYYRS